MGKVRALEAELKGRDPSTAYGAEAADWDMLSSMKKDLGMKVNFKSPNELKEEERALNAGWHPEKK